MTSQELHRWAALATLTSAERAVTYFLLAHLNVPTAFDQQSQLYLLVDDHPARLDPADIAAATEQLGFLLSPPATPLQLTAIGERRLRYPDLLDAPFATYLQAENLYQSYLLTQEPAPLSDLFALLTHTEEKGEADSASTDAAPELAPAAADYLLLLYLFSQKSRISHLFPHLYAPAPSEPPTYQGLMAAMNAQIRTLTHGDITKETQVLEAPTERALVELNERAREVQEHRPPAL